MYFWLSLENVEVGRRETGRSPPSKVRRASFHNGRQAPRRKRRLCRSLDSFRQRTRSLSGEATYWYVREICFVRKSEIFIVQSSKKKTLVSRGVKKTTVALNILREKNTHTQSETFVGQGIKNARSENEETFLSRFELFFAVRFSVCSARRTRRRRCRKRFGRYRPADERRHR